MFSPVVLVLDDVHVLRNRECLSAPSVLADHVPAGSRLVVAGRADPLPCVARLRAEGRILEIGPRDLSLTVEEASSLLHHAGLMLGDNEAAGLHRRTDGPLACTLPRWPSKRAVRTVKPPSHSPGATSSCTTTCGLNSSTGSQTPTCRS